MAQTPGTVMVTRPSISTIGSKLKKGTRVAAGVALSTGLLATFALPAYATSNADGAPDLVPAQQLTTVSVDSALAIELPQATTADEIAAEQRKQAEAAAVAEAEAEAATAAGAADKKVAERASMSVGDIAAGSGASGVLSAAHAQLGWNQDCTDLVQNALAAAGMTTSRLDGGYDMGITDFRQFGTPVASGNYAPGDILIWPGQHVAIYAGNGQAVHGGWGGNQTVVNTAWSPSSTPEVIRIG